VASLSFRGLAWGTGLSGSPLAFLKLAGRELPTLRSRQAGAGRFGSALGARGHCRRTHAATRVRAQWARAEAEVTHQPAISSRRDWWAYRRTVGLVGVSELNG
jgi:hypothetical protein